MQMSSLENLEIFEKKQLTNHWAMLSFGVEFGHFGLCILKQLVVVLSLVQHQVLDTMLKDLVSLKHLDH